MLGPILLTPQGAQTSAMIYSIVDTAKENELNPSVHLTYLFDQLRGVDATADLLDAYRVPPLPLL